MPITGDAWILTNPIKPYALFDPNAKRDIPMDWTDWLDDIGSTYASHTIICETGLQCSASSEALGVITAAIEAAPAAILVVGRKYGVTFRIIAANGEQDDRTLYLKITNR